MRVKKTKKKISLSLKLFYLVVLTLIIISISMARYRTTYQGELNGDTADWVFLVNGDTQTFTIDLSDTIDTQAQLSNGYAHNDNVIAPTAKGEFTITLDYTGCDVSTDYEINVTPHTGTTLPKELYIYSTTLNQNKTSILNKTIVNSVTLEEMQNNPTSQLIINWMWQVNFDKSESNYEGKNLQIDVTITGKQHI